MLVVLVPAVVVTVTSTPPLPAGATAEIEPLLLTVNDAAGDGPNSTAVTPVKFEPVMVTAVAPAAGPELGVTFCTTGELHNVLANAISALLGENGGPSTFDPDASVVRAVASDGNRNPCATAVLMALVTTQL